MTTTTESRKRSRDALTGVGRMCEAFVENVPVCFYSRQHKNDATDDESGGEEAGLVNSNTNNDGVPLSPLFIKNTFLLLGVGVLVPWNFFVSAKPYFQSRLCRDHHEIAVNIEYWFSVLYNGASVLSLAVVVLVQFLADRKPQPGIKSSFGWRVCSASWGSGGVDTSSTVSTEYSWYLVVVPLAIYLAVLFFTTVLVFLPLGAVSSHFFLVATLLGLFLCGVCTAIASSGIVGTAGLFDPNIGVNPYFNGQAVGGVFVALANFVTAAIDGPSSFRLEHCAGALGGPDEGHQQNYQEQELLQCIPYTEISWATVAYFASGCVVLVACIIGYNYVDQYKHIVILQGVPREYTEIISDDEVGTDVSSDVASDDLESTPLNPSKMDDSTQSTSVSAPAKSQISDIAETEPAETTTLMISYQHSTTYDVSAIDTDSDSNGCSEQSTTLCIWKVVQGPAVSLFWTYFVTLAIFPVWTSELSSVAQCESTARIRNDLFSPLSFVIFNGGDLVGRMISAEADLDKVRHLPTKLVLSSIGRFTFFILFLFCAAQNSQFTSLVIHSDIFSWIVQFIFAVTNGALTNVAFCYAAGLVDGGTHPQQVASAILNFSLCFGLLCGSFFSYPFLGFASGNWL